MSANDKLDSYHAIVSLLGAGGIYIPWQRLKRLSNPNPLEARIQSVLLSLIIFFCVMAARDGLSFLYFGRFMVLATVVLVLNLVLYFETLYRRHIPRVLKYLTAAYVVFFSVDSVLPFTFFTLHEQLVFGMPTLLLCLSIWYIGVSRRREDYGRSENAFIRLSLLTFPIIVFFFATEFEFVKIQFPVPRLSVLGALLFTYSLFYDQTIESGQSSYRRNILLMLLFSGVLTFSIYLLVLEPDVSFILETFCLFMVINLFLRIVHTASDLDAKDNFFSFVKAVVEAEKKDRIEFLRELKKFFSRIEIQRLTPEFLREYDTKGIHDFFVHGQIHLVSLFDLKSIHEQKTVSSGATQDLEIIEQMIDILEKTEHSYLFHVTVDDEIFVVFNYQLPGQSNVISTQTALVSEITKLIRK